MDDNHNRRDSTEDKEFEHINLEENIPDNENKEDEAEKPEWKKRLDRKLQGDSNWLENAVPLYGLWITLRVIWLFVLFFGMMCTMTYLAEKKAAAPKAQTLEIGVDGAVNESEEIKERCGSHYAIVISLWLFMVAVYLFVLMLWASPAWFIKDFKKAPRHGEHGGKDT
ncbi:hypothetical protein B0J14DRAFT_559654 [Halenospora varia]|nr:hypothetical protein B0J14DRAFT_559654 [Halenospora varia]